MSLPAVGDILAGKYKIVKLLGKGGMGVVFLAKHEILRQHLRVARHVEDELLGIQRSELTTQLGKRVDDLGRRASHAGVEEREEARWPSADDRDVLHFVFHE